MDEAKTTISIDVDGKAGPVRLGVNGKIVELPRGKSFEATNAQIEALDNAGISYSTWGDTAVSDEPVADEQPEENEPNAVDEGSEEPAEEVPDGEEGAESGKTTADVDEPEADAAEESTGEATA